MPRRVESDGARALGRQRRTEQLVEQFGPEYARAVHEYGSRDRAEMALETRTERVEQPDIRPSSAEQRSRFASEWRDVQSRFGDSSEGAVRDADRPFTEAMQARG